MSFGDWILLGVILLCAGAAVAHILRGKKSCCGNCRGCSGRCFCGARLIFGGLAHYASGGHKMPKGVDTMMNRFTQLRRKEVINLCDGCRLGCVGDVEVKLPEGEVRALIVFGPSRFFGLFGRGEDYYIPWDCIQKFGDDIILIDKPFQRRDGPPDRKRRHWG